jgi:hypothetical protein
MGLFITSHEGCCEFCTGFGTKAAHLMLERRLTRSFGKRKGAEVPYTRQNRG